MGVTVEIKPHAYDPVERWELFDGVLPRRLLAFAIDLAIVFAVAALAAVTIILLGLVTLGFGWWLLALLYPGTVVWALIYYGSTLGGPASATIGMRVMEIELRTWYGAPCYFVLGAVHAVVFYITMSTLTPLVLLVGLFNGRQRLLHDVLVGTVMINNARRAATLRAVAAV
ncbi:MAG TPA: RDD family protein [Xanthobacteraceae bacterium]|nr:RDD family protein [Xanthobacteraceae bacterium]